MRVKWLVRLLFLGTFEGTELRLILTGSEKESRLVVASDIGLRSTGILLVVGELVYVDCPVFSCFFVVNLDVVFLILLLQVFGLLFFLSSLFFFFGLLFLQKLDHVFFTLEGQFFDFVYGDSSEQRQHLVVGLVHSEHYRDEYALGQQNHHKGHCQDNYKRFLVVLSQIVIKTVKQFRNCIARLPQNEQSVGLNIEKVFLRAFQIIWNSERSQTRVPQRRGRSDVLEQRVVEDILVNLDRTVLQQELYIVSWLGCHPSPRVKQDSGFDDIELIVLQVVH